MKNMEKEKGYVYILTNPAFREDWVKIGKTEKSVEERMESLFTTALPERFELYAWCKTTKYCIKIPKFRLYTLIIYILSTKYKSFFKYICAISFIIDNLF